MSYTAVQTDNGIEIRRNNGDVVTTVSSWPPKEDAALEILFEDANISKPQKDLFKLLFGVIELQQDTSQ